MDENNIKENNSSAPSASSARSISKEGTYESQGEENARYSQDHNEKLDRVQHGELSMNNPCKEMTIDQNNITANQDPCSKASNTDEMTMNYSQVPREKYVYERNPFDYHDHQNPCKDMTIDQNNIAANQDRCSKASNTDEMAMKDPQVPREKYVYERNPFDYHDHQKEQSSSQCIASSIPHYTKEEALLISEKLKTGDTFDEASSTVLTWIERGECTMENVDSFFSILTNIQHHVKRIQDDKCKSKNQVKHAKKMNKEFSRIFSPVIEESDKFYKHLSEESVLDMFTAEQKKSIDSWKRQFERIKLREECDTLSCQLSEAQNRIKYLQLEQQGELKGRDEKINALCTMVQNTNKKKLNVAEIDKKNEAEIEELRDELKGQTSSQFKRRSHRKKAVSKVLPKK